jgi:TolB protein
VIQVGRRASIGGVVVAVWLLVLAGCDRDANSFRSLNLEATATGDTTVETVPLKTLVVGDVASPRLKSFLDGKSYTTRTLNVLDVTDVPYVHYAAQDVAMDGDYIVWSDNRNGNSDIYAYQISTQTEFAITTAAGTQRYPEISGDYVVWEDYRNGNADIYAYRISTGKVFAITTADHNQRYPQIDGDYAVWQDERGSDADIYAYQFSAAAEFPVSMQAGVEEWVPQIKGDVIVWQAYAGGFSDIYGYRISTSSVFPVSVAAGSSQYSPALSDNYVVWIDNRNSGSDDDIYAYNLTTGVESPVTTATGPQWAPRVSGNYAVWQDYRNGTDYDIYARDLAGGDEFKVSSAPNQQINPEISGDTIAWQDFRNGNYDIYTYTISTGTETHITSQDSDQTRPLLNGNNLAWLDARRGVVDVYYRFGLNGADELATNTWETPAGTVNDLSDYQVVVLGSDIPSNEIMLQIFDAAIAAGVNVLGLGGTGVSLAGALAEAGRYGLSVTPNSGCAPLEILPSVTEADNSFLFTDLNLGEVLPLEMASAVTQDELAINTDANDPDSPADWDVWATFGGNMCNAADPAVVGFTDPGGSRIILDGSASTADSYLYWISNRWTLLSNEALYLTQ